jgi:hypothetical protein
MGHGEKRNARKEKTQRPHNRAEMRTPATRTNKGGKRRDTLPKQCTKRHLCLLWATRCHFTLATVDLRSSENRTLPLDH